MSVFYNEHDPFAAAHLRELIADGLIAPGVVDERSIEDVRPDELSGHAQCHFFAGIGIWSLALRQAGWADDRPIWTGSCPCQPFSAAGQGGGFADERHLWPAFGWLVSQRRPPVVAGEQVASKDVDPWVDLVQADVEALGYAFGCVPFPAAGVGAPHIRDRTYWMAYAEDGDGWRGERGAEAEAWAHEERGRGSSSRRDADGLAHAGCSRPPQLGWRREQPTGSTPVSAFVRLADTDGRDAGTERLQRSGKQRQQPQDRGIGHNGAPGPVNGLWRDADWLLCQDEKWRAVEPGTFPLADAGTFRNRVGLLRGAGNAVTLGQAQAFIECMMEHLDQQERLAT